MNNGMCILTPHVIKLRNLLHRMSQILQIYMDLKSGWTNSWQETSHQGLLNTKMPSEAQEVPEIPTVRKWEGVLLKYQYMLVLFLQSFIGHPLPFAIRDWMV